MKKRLLFIGLLLFAFMGRAMAGEYITTYELTNEKLVIENGVSGDRMVFQLKGQNLPANGLGYYLYLVKSPTDPFNNSLLTESDSNGCVPPSSALYNVDGLIRLDTNNQNVAAITERWYLYKEYNYARIVYTEKVDNKVYCRVSTGTVAIDKEGQGVLPKRNEMFSFFLNVTNTDLDIYYKYPAIETGQTHQFKINAVTKIGLVTDNTLLGKLSLDFDGNIGELITYAKNDNTNVIFNETKELDDGSVKYAGVGTAISEKINPDGIYYVYNTLTSDEVELRNLDGVTLAKADLKDGIYRLYAWSDFEGEDFDYKGSVDPLPDAPASEQPAGSGTVENPKTGMFIGFVGLFAISIAILILLIKNKKQFFKI